MLCNLSYWAPELYGFVATWPSRLFYFFQNLKERLTFVTDLRHEAAQRSYSSCQALNVLNV